MTFSVAAHSVTPEIDQVDYRQFGAASRQVSAIGQGTWNMERASIDSALRALRAGIDSGLMHIDTAEMYGSGKAEQVVGEAILGRRDDVFLVSKVLPSNASRKGVLRACEASLARLKTDRLDCYLLHWRGSHPLEETVASFEQLMREGKILSWGVSNFDVADLEEVCGLSESNQPSCNQVLYHVAERAVEHDVIPWCAARGIAVVAYSPFGGESGFPKPNSNGGRTLESVAAAHGATQRQVALQFLLRNSGVFAIPKASTAEHVAEIAGAGRLELSAAQIAQIDEAFPRGRRPRSLPML